MNSDYKKTVQSLKQKFQKVAGAECLLRQIDFAESAVIRNKGRLNPDIYILHLVNDFAAELSHDVISAVLLLTRPRGMINEQRALDDFSAKTKQLYLSAVGGDLTSSPELRQILMIQALVCDDGLKDALKKQPSLSYTINRERVACMHYAKANLAVCEQPSCGILKLDEAFLKRQNEITGVMIGKNQPKP